MSKRPASRGFTLVEMLVVLAIILVLISMLMPAWHLVRHQANVEICQNNMKQIASCIFQYAQENDNYIPPNRVEYCQWGGNSNWDARMWYDVILRYGPGGSTSSILGPAVVNGGQGTGNFPNTPFAKTSIINGCPEFRYYWWGGCSSATGYAITFMPFMPGTHDQPTNYSQSAPYKGGGPGDSPNWNWIPDSQGPPLNPGGWLWFIYASWTKLDSVTLPTQRGLLGEVTGWAGFPRPPSNGNNQYPNPNDQDGFYGPYRRQTGAFDGNWGDTDFFRHTINGGTQVDANGKPMDVNRPGVNVVFFDGHVEEVTPWDCWWCTMDPRKFGQKIWRNPPNWP